MSIGRRTGRCFRHGLIGAPSRIGSERSAVLEPERRLGGPVEGQRIGLDVLGFSIATNASIGQSKEDAEYQWIVTPGWWFCSGGGRLDLGSDVELTHLRLEKTSEGDVAPDQGVGELSAIYSGRGKETEEEREHLSAIIEVLNERFGLKLGTADQLFFDQLEATWMGDDHLLDQARANPIENFRLVFNDVFIKSIVGRMDDNEDIFKKILDEPAFQAAVMDHYLRRVFDQARARRPGGE